MSAAGLGIKSVTGMTVKTASDKSPVYVITADTVSITLENWTDKAIASATVSSSGYYTTEATSVTDIAAGGTTKINLTTGTKSSDSTLSNS